jgi:hypothetical protein
MSHSGNDALNDHISDIKGDIMLALEEYSENVTDEIERTVRLKSHQPGQLDVYCTETHKKLGVLTLTLEIEGRD